MEQTRLGGNGGKMKNKYRIVVIIVCCLICFLCGAFFGFYYRESLMMNIIQDGACVV